METGAPSLQKERASLLSRLRILRAIKISEDRGGAGDLIVAMTLPRPGRQVGERPLPGSLVRQLLGGVLWPDRHGKTHPRWAEGVCYAKISFNYCSPLAPQSHCLDASVALIVVTERNI